MEYLILPCEGDGRSTLCNHEPGNCTSAFRPTCKEKAVGCCITGKPGIIPTGIPPTEE